MRDDRTPARAVARGATLGAVLAGVAGYADATAYLKMHVFVANITGSTVLLGIAAAERSSTHVVLSLATIAAFTGGCVLGEIVVAGRGRVALGLALEAVFLALASIDEHGFGMLVLAGVGMGLQNTSAGTFGGIPANTSFVTGDDQHLARALTRIARGRGADRDRRTVAIVAPLLLAYLGSAALAAALTRTSLRHLLLLAALTVLGLAVAVHRTPPDDATVR